MDTPIERKPGITRKHLYVIGGIAFVIAVVLYFIFRDTTSSMTVEKERLTIATVNRGEFNDYIRVIGQVMPNRIIYMDAVEGGRVEERLKEEGAMVKAGDVILRLSNPLLNIGIMQSEADLAYQENELRNTRISMEQERLRLKQERIGLNKDRLVKQRRYEQYSRLIKEQLIAEEDYRLAKEEYDAAKEQLDVIDERIRQDNIFRESQVNSLDENIRNMKQSLALVRERIENLKVKAPIDGQVGNLDAQIGQSIAAGEHIGQIITSDLKVQAQIDEHYVERVVPGLPADFTRDGVSYKLEVTKPYPEVKVTPEVRQEGFEAFVTTDDHLMHLTGIAKDQNGSKYYITKNSWGTDRNKFGGYLNMSESFVRAKTIYVMVHKDAIPKAIKTKLGL